MANAHISKYGFSSPGCDGRKLFMHCFHRAAGLVNFFRQRLKLYQYHELTPFRFGKIIAGTQKFAMRVVQLTFVISLTTTTAAVEFEASGEIQYTQYKYQRPGEIFEEMAFSFLVIRSGSSWSIETRPQKPQHVSVSLAAWDGQRLYYFSSIEEWVRSQAQTGRAVSPNTVEGAVLPTEIPNVLAAHQLSPIWLMYCSANYLNGRTNGGLIEPSATRSTVSGANLQIGLEFYQQAFWNLNSENGLPSSVAYYDDGQMRDETGKLKHTWPPPFDKGFTNALFTVSERIGTDAGSLPMEATLDVFVPNLITKKLDLMHRYIMRAKNARLTSDAVLAFPPKLPGHTIMADRRFTRQTVNRVVSLEYITDRFLSETEVKNTAAYSNAVFKTQRNAQIESPRPSIGRWKVGVFLIFMVSTAVILVVCSRRIRTTANPKP